MSLSALTAGIRVNKDKNATALALQGEPSTSRPSASVAPGQLDFFASSLQPNVQQPTSKRSKKSKQKSKEVQLASAEESQSVRKQNKIKIQGEACNLFTDFDQLALPTELAQTLLDNSWDQPTAIQMQAIPLMLQHRDLLACASTGSGKTLAFVSLYYHLENLRVVTDISMPQSCFPCSFVIFSSPGLRGDCGR